MRHVGLRLVIIIIRYKIFHCIFRKKAPELVGELGRQRFIVGDDQRRLLDSFDHLGHGIGFTRTGDAQQGLKFQPFINAVGQFPDGLFLVALWLDVYKRQVLLFS